ncbi:MAG: hypothetical protein H0V66_06470 [Bdellovibrionales bacterium]|nr:hypothetical protein [Bdellovibrionales bacterium]
MKKLLILSSIILSFSSVSNSMANDKWSCTAKDGLGREFIGLSQSKKESEELALSNCKRNSSIQNCHVDPFVLCTPPSSPVLWECKAKDAFGREYLSTSQVREEAKTLALANCNRNSSAGNCHIIDALGGACEQKVSAKPVKVEPVKTVQQTTQVQNDNEQESVAIQAGASGPGEPVKKYENLSINSDGSYTIEAPTFKFDGRRYYLSPSSSPEGVCKKFGFEKYVANSLEAVDSRRDFIILDKESKYAGIQFGSKVLKYLSCKNEDATLNVEGNWAESVSENDDGTVTIRRPMFKFKNKHKFFHVTSSLDGICKLYGKGKAIDSKNTRFNYDLHIVVDEQGRFVNDNGGRDNKPGDEDQIHKVVC